MPPSGERFVPLVETGGVTIEAIVSAAAEAETVYEQDHDEWVMVVTGRASMTVADDLVELGPGDWLWLPAGVRHVVESVELGTRWLAVHLPPSAEAEPGPA